MGLMSDRRPNTRATLPASPPTSAAARSLAWSRPPAIFGAWPALPGGVASATLGVRSEPVEHDFAYSV